LVTILGACRRWRRRGAARASRQRCKNSQAKGVEKKKTIGASGGEKDMASWQLLQQLSENISGEHQYQQLAQSLAPGELASFG